MKRKILALILSVVMVFTLFAGCGLFVESPERMTEEAVVTVGSGEYAQKITSNEILNVFNQYIIYVYYGMSVEEIVDISINSLVNSKIMTIAALENMPKISERKGDLYGSYLTDAEIDEVEAKVDTLISKVIDDIEVELIRTAAELEKAADPRVTPSDFSYTTAIPRDFIETDTRNAAYKKFERQIISNGLTFDRYRSAQVEAYKKSKVVEKYKDSILADISATDADVQARYDAIIEAEKEKYAINTSQFATKLKAMAEAGEYTSDNFALYTPELGYGLGYNLLLSFSEEQLKQIEGWKAELKENKITTAEYNAKREALAKEIVISDLRTDWLKNYGSSTDLFKNNPFDGEMKPTLVGGVQARDDEGYFAYETLAANEYSVTEFLNKLSTAMGASKAGAVGGFDMYKGDPSKKDVFMNFIWAFGGDGGAFNNEVGYVLYPTPSDSGYVAEFAEATKSLATTTEGTYVTVTTDYGIHIVLLVDKFDAIGVNDTYVSSDKNIEGTFSNLFFNAVEESIKDNFYTEKASSFAAAYMKDDKFIKYDTKKLAETVAYINSILGQ